MHSLKARAENGQEGEFFKYCFAHKFDIDKALKLIEAGDIPFTVETISVKPWAEAVLTPEIYPRNGDGTFGKPTAIPILSIPIDPAAAMSIPDEAATKPGIAIFLPRQDGEGEFALLIDGHHRLFRAYVNGIETMSFYVIRDPEAIKKFYSHSCRVKSLFARRGRKRAARKEAA